MKSECVSRACLASKDQHVLTVTEAVSSRKHCRAALGRTVACSVGLMTTLLAGTVGEGVIASELDGGKNGTPASRSIDINEVVVTARKREESSLDVPATVTGFSSADLERYGVSNLTEIGQMTPHVNMGVAGGSGGGFLSIRGIGTSPNNVGFDQAVSINVDGVQISRGRLITSAFFDLEQVEILKGPQALFFGKNSPAGVISLSSKGPGDTLEGYLRTSYELNAKEKIVEGAIGGPLSNSVGARLAVRATDMKGFMRNLAQPIANPYGPAAGPDMLPGASESRLGQESMDGRFTLTVMPGETFSGVLKIYYSSFEDDGFASNWQGFGCAPGQPLLTEGGVADPFDNCRIDKRLSRGDMAREIVGAWPFANGGVPYREFDSVLASWRMDYERDNFMITSVTGFMDYTTQYFDTSDATVYGYYAAAERDKTDTLSQEVRLISDFDGPVNVTLGGYYEKSNIDFASGVRIAPVGPDLATGKWHSFERRGKTEGEAWSLFGQVIVDITDTIELTGGARWTREEKDSGMKNTYVHPALAGVLTERNFPARFKDDNVSPEATVRWRITDDWTVFAAYRTGYKSGGYSLASILLESTNVENITFDPEEAEGFEIGMKAVLLEGRLRLDGSVYRYNFKDLQVNSFDPNTVSFAIANAAAARQSGAELAAQLVATDNLTLRGSLGYNRSRYRNFDTASCYAGQTAEMGCNPVTSTQDLSGRPTTRAPDWSGNFGLTYDVGLTPGWRMSLSADANYSDGHYVSDVISPAAFQSSFTRVDGAVTVYSVDDKWQVSLIGRNLTDKIYLVDSNDKPGGVGMQQYGSIARPKEILMSLTVNF